MAESLRAKVQGVCLVAGIAIAGVGLVLACYASYLEHTTGATILDQPVVEGQPLLIDLDPQMNPVHLRWSAEVVSSRRLRDALFAASLRFGDNVVWSGEVSMWTRRFGKSPGRDAGAIATVDVPEAGRYTFAIDRNLSSNYRQAQVGDLRIEVKRNTRMAPEWCLPAGIALLVVGFVLFGLALMLEPKLPA